MKVFDWLNRSLGGLFGNWLRAGRRKRPMPNPPMQRFPTARTSCRMDRRIGIAWSEMLEHHQIFSVAAVGDLDSVRGGGSRNEKFVFGHLAVSYQGWRLYGMHADGAIALRQNQSVRGTVTDDHRAARPEGQFLCRIVHGRIYHPLFAVAGIGHFLDRRNRPWFEETVRLEVRGSVFASQSSMSRM